VLSGAKAWVPEVAAADVVLVVAGADDGVGLFAVATGDDGVDLAVTPTVDGTRRWGEVALVDVTARRLGGGDATAALAGVLDRVLVGFVVDGVGAAQRVMELAVEYAKERVQFDRPIGSFQAVQHLCADMLHDVELARAGAYYALWAGDAAPPEELHRAATMAKAFASDALAGVGASAIQVFGGVGFTWDHDAHLFYKRLLTLQHAYGGTAEHLEELARIVMP
jgi:alkylation response protein AidB-like acyl-CoA dehydrogenase